MGWTRFFRRARWDDERARELESYLEIETAENIERGMTPDEARDAARRRLGNATLIREEIFHMNTITFLENLWQDLRYGARLLRRNPVFAVVAILSLALGIGANAAIFELLNAVRLRTLPVKSPQELVEVRIAETPNGRTGSFRGRNSRLTNPLWEEIRQQQRGFSEMLAWGDERFNLSPGGIVRPADGIFVSGGFFDALGVRAAAGRLFSQADDRPGCGMPGVVISYAFWQREFGGQPSAIGQKLLITGHPVEVIGVAASGFFGVEVGRSFDVAVPICSEPVIHGEMSGLARRDSWWLAAFGRLRPGWSRVQAEAQLRAISPALFQSTTPANYTAEDAKNYAAFRLGAFPAASGVSSLRREYETPLYLLLAIALIVLLVACANLANLMLARASAREREIAVRLAIGAARGRIVRQLLTESLLLAVFGAALGAWLAQMLSRFLVAFISTDSRRLFVDLGPDWRVLGFTALLAAGTCLMFGLTPAIRATRTTPGAVMKAAGRGLTDSRERFGLRRALVVSQVALSLVLVVSAVLFVRTLSNLMTLDAGFRQEGILVADLDLRRADIPPDRRLAAYREILDGIRAIPGVTMAAESMIVPVSGAGWNENVVTDGREGRKPKVLSNFDRVSAGFFRTMGTPVLAGRDFDEHDAMGAPTVAIVNEAFAKAIVGAENPVGRTFEQEQIPGEPRRVFQIVGLVRDAKYSDLREDFPPIVYLPTTQDEAPFQGSSMLIRSDMSLTALTGAVTQVIAGVSRDIAVEFQPLVTQIRESLLRERLMATLSGFFGGLAALLATIGLYGVISYMVARRRHEIGIRMALGADRGVVLRLIMSEAAILVGAGIGVGVVLALAAARAAGTLLFGLQPGDPSTLILSIAALASIAAIASYLPARRAAGVDPTVALRGD